MTENIKNYAPAAADEALLEVLAMRLYDIQNRLAIQLETKESKKEYIQYKAVSGLNGKFYKFTVCCEEIE